MNKTFFSYPFLIWATQMDCSISDFGIPGIKEHTICSWIEPMKFWRNALYNCVFQIFWHPSTTSLAIQICLRRQSRSKPQKVRIRAISLKLSNGNWSVQVAYIRLFYATWSVLKHERILFPFFLLQSNRSWCWTMEVRLGTKTWDRYGGKCERNGH